MDPSIVKLLEDDEDETMHSGADVEAFQAALNRDIGGDASNSHLSDSDAGSNNSFSQSLPTWTTSSHDNQTDSQNQEPKIEQQQEQPSSETEQGPVLEPIQTVSSQDASNLNLSHSQSQDESLQRQTLPVSHQQSQTNEVIKSEKEPVFNNEAIKTNNPNEQSQYAKLQQMSNQQASVNEQPSSQVNRSKQVPFGLLLPILIPQLPKDRAMQLQTLFNKLKRDEIPKEHFVRLMKGIVGDQMLRIALTKVQQQTKTNTGSSGQQPPVRMPTVTSSGTKFNDPHALAQLHQRSMNAAADHSHNASSAIQVKSEPTYSTMDISAKKPQEHDVRVVQSNQLPTSSSIAVSQETERSAVHMQGLNKQQQQHIHFPSTYGGSGGNYSHFSGTTTSSSSSFRPQPHPHDSHIRQIPHPSIGLNHLSAERQSSFNDPKRMPGGSVSTVVNNTSSHQTSNSWQTSAEQNSGLFSSTSYVKKEPNDLSIEQQHRHHLSKLHGLPSVNSGQNEQGSGINQGTVKDEFSRGSLASTSMAHTTSASLLAPNTASHFASQPDPTVSVSSQIPASTSGVMSKTPLKKPPLGQKKPLEALGSSPPPPSKKQKVSSLEPSIDQLNDVTAVSGVDLREEEEQLFSGPKDDSRVSEAFMLSFMSPLKFTMTNIVLCLLLFCVHVILIFAASSESDWINHGGDLFNRRYAYKEQKINIETVPKLSLKWKFYANKDITATPTIYNGTIYFPSWNGNIYAIKQIDGSLVWKQNLEKLTGLNTTGFIINANWTVARATPTVAEDLLIVGIYGPAVVIGLERRTGELVWLTHLDNHPAAVVTMSGTYYNGSYYVGTSSLEEGATIKDCCIFRGSLVKLDAQTGDILWKTHMLPDNNGKIGAYAGAAIWGSSPSIDVYRKHVYIATGNLYSAPKNVLECQERQNNQTTPIEQDKCVEPENHSNSILALDLDSGNIEWYKQLGGYDVWFVSCNNASISNCPPQGSIPDADFGEAPMMLTTHVNGTMKDIVVAVQKSGFAWALDRDNGTLLWFTEAGPSGIAGGGTFGAATDEKRIYTNIANSDAKTFKLLPSNMNTTSGGWVAMDASNGTILWSTANPSINSTASGPVSVANEVVFVGSTDRLGHIYAINGRNGHILWSYETGASVYGGMSISNGCVYVGHGYNVSLGFYSNYTGGTSLFAFCV